MKTLEVHSLESYLDGIADALKLRKTELINVAKAVDNLVSAEHILAGHGGDAIRTFYQECHLPFLQFYGHLIDQYCEQLDKIKKALFSLEPSKNGFISEAFLQQDLTQALKRAKNETVGMTNDTNQVINSVSDIVSLPNLQDDDFIDDVTNALKNIDQTIEKLHDFDQEQTTALSKEEADIQTMQQYLTQLESMFMGARLVIPNYVSGQILTAMEPEKEAKEVSKGKAAVDEPNAWEKMIEKLRNIELNEDPSVALDLFAPVSSVGNTFGTLAEGTAVSQTAYNVYKHGLSIQRQGDKFIVKNGNVIGIKGKNYSNSWIESQLKRGHTPEIAKHVKPTAALADTMKSKIGWVGIGITAGENAIKNINSDAPMSKTIGDAGVDVGVGAVSLGLGAVAVSGLALLGAPLLVTAAAGFVVSAGISYALEGIKVEGTSLSDNLKSKAQKGVETVAGWFK